MGKERVPWTELQRAQGNYIRSRYLPKGVTLKQYYHFRHVDIKALHNHWTQRQATGKVPFCFREAVKAIWKNQYTPEENDADIDMGLAEETEVGL